MRLLIVEDKARTRSFLVHAFEADGFSVDAVKDTDSALRLVLNGSYELAILDLP